MLPLQGVSQKRLALFGLGGVGKTQLALEYVYWLKEPQPHISIFWVHANNAERFRDAFMTIAETYGLPGYDDPQVDILLVVKKWLEKRESGRWLMVIDNADEIQLFYGRPTNDANDSPDGNETNLARYIPDCSHGTILITTRDKKTGFRLTNGSQLVEVGNMGLDESEELLRDKLEGIDLLRGTGLQDLASRLEYLPLALVQAASFIRENSISVPRYLTLLDRGDHHFVELLSEEFEAVGRDTQTPHAITSTWILSFEQIQKQNEFAGRLLSFMSCLDRQAIPSEILQLYSIRYHIDKDVIPEIELTRALGILISFSFITEGSDGHFTMHRLVQLVSQKWLVRKGIHRYSAGDALQVVNSIYPIKCRDPENWGRCNSYLAHAYAVLKGEYTESQDLENSACLAWKLAKFLESAGHYTKAESLYLKAEESLRNGKHERSPLMLDCVTDLAGLYADLGRAYEAEEHQMQWLEAIADALEQEQYSKIIEKCKLAGDYHREGRLEEADLLQAEIVRSAVMLEQDPSVASLDFLEGLSTTYIHQLRWKEAEALLLYILTLYNTITTKGFNTSLRVIHAKCNLAVVYHNQGRLEESMDLKLEELKGMKAVYGDEHPGTTDLKASLAADYRKQNHLDTAELLLTQVVETSRKVAGQEHPYTVRYSLDLAEVYFERNQPEKAEQILIPALKILETTFGEEDRHTALAVTLLGEADPRPLNSLHQCGVAGFERHKFKEAAEIFKKEFEIRKRVQGEESMDALRSLEWLANAQYKCDNFEDSRSLYKQLFEVYGRLLEGERRAYNGSSL